MALLAWDEVTWPDFVAGLEGFRDHFPRAAQAPDAFPENAAGHHPPPEQVGLPALHRAGAGRARDMAGRQGPRARAESTPLTISDPRLPAHAEELGAMHDDLIAHMRANGVNSMGDAAASKALYVLRPRLFVMWDKEIRRSAPEGYGAYLLQMHALALRLTDEAPAADVEAYLQELLGYETRKTLAKYLDEYNWFEAVGREQLTRRTGSSR